MCVQSFSHYRLVWNICSSLSSARPHADVRVEQEAGPSDSRSTKSWRNQLGCSATSAGRAVDRLLDLLH